MPKPETSLYGEEDEEDDFDIKLDAQNTGNVDVEVHFLPS
jgi:hypothetical protein